VRVGLFLLAARFAGQPDGEVLARSLECVTAAEAAGFDDVWIAEHHFIPYGVCPSATTFAALALGRTRRIGVGTAVSVLSTQHPVALAEQTALLDQLSGGRFHLGVGRGGPWVDLEVFGTGLDRFERDFPESLDLLLAWLTTDRVARATGPFQFRPVAVVPRPHSQPRPPITVACTSEETMRVAAVRGLPMMLGMHIGDEEKAAMVTGYAAVAARHGHDSVPAHISAAMGYVADSTAEALAVVRATLPEWLERGVGAYQTVDGRPRRPFDAAAYTDLLCRLHPVGTPEQCVARLRDSAAHTGVRHVILMLEGGGSRNRTLENIARFGAQVLPALRTP
jgi:alkanesulfonate monooxygenase SsuD/methylene tetrahydromethanopterin reductase-like flavin-dependent oxidoreductase (luciferase family)